ncbi:MAG: hypothetical protein ABFQ64_09665 [Campylobacterota bacterium]
MFGSILGKGKDKKSKNSTSSVHNKISKMNISEMRSYVNSRVANLNLTKEGLAEVMKKLTLPSEKTSKLYIAADDMDTKKKKGFDLVLLIVQNEYVDLDILEQIRNFTVVYEELINEYDTKHKEIYSSRFADAISLAEYNLNRKK